MAMTKEQQRALALARARQRQQQGNEVVGRGGILPFSRQADGDIQFDSDAGVVGAIKRAFFLPGEVMAGEVDPLSDEGIDRAAEMAAVANPANPAVRAGDRLIPGASRAMRKPDVKAPTADELRDASTKGYEEARGMGVDYSSAAVSDMANSVRRELEADGILQELAPQTFSILKKLESAPADSVAPIQGLEAARRSFAKASRNFNNPTDQEAARRVRERLDGFLEDGDPGSVVAGPSTKAARTMRDARGNYAAAKRSDQLTGIEETAELRASVANSGQNLDNATRQRLASLLLNQRKSAGFNGGERAAIERVARGTRGRNFLRGAGNVFGGGGGLGMMLTGSIGGGAGAMAGGPVGAAIGAAVPTVAGSAMKSGAARLTQRGLRDVDEMTRRRSPLYEQRVRGTPVEAVGTANRTAPLRGAMIGNMSTEDATQAIRQVQAAQREGRISESEARQIIALISGNGA